MRQRGLEMPLDRIEAEHADLAVIVESGEAITEFFQKFACRDCQSTGAAITAAAAVAGRWIKNEECSLKNRNYQPSIASLKVFAMALL